MFNLPAGNLTSLLIDYNQRVFGDDDQTPDIYRWSSNGRETRINIGGPYVIDEAKPFNIPAIRIKRGDFKINTRMNDNFIEAKDTFSEISTKGYIYEGPVTIIVSARTPIEATNIAQYVSMRMQNDRHRIIHTGKFLRNLHINGISDEQPKEAQGKVHRYEVMIYAWASIMSLITEKPIDVPPFNILSMHGEGEYFEGVVNGASGDNYVVDTEHTFGTDNTFDFYFDPTELSNNKYYIRFGGYVYQVTGIRDANSLFISGRDEDDNVIAGWTLSEDVTNAEYELFWNVNNIHWIIKNEEE